jgi:metallo-beta-lactamase class B
MMNLLKPIIVLVVLLSSAAVTLPAANISTRFVRQGEDGFPTALELAQPKMRRLARDVWVGKVSSRLWVHTTTRQYPDGTIYPANGMLMETDNASVLFDTGWTDAQTAVLLLWAERNLRKPVAKVIVSHAHEDRLGGIDELKRKQIPVYSLALTNKFARAQGVKNPPIPLPGLEADILRDKLGYDLFFPGAGHSRDNLVVYFRRERVLFGGCLVKSSSSPSLGNLDDAVLADWPITIARLKNTYPDARILVPGHGTLNGDSLARTLELLRMKNAG